MNNFVHAGHSLKVVAPYDVADGDGLLCGALFGIARSWARCGEDVEILTDGVFDLQREADEHWAVGDRVYWDDQSRKFRNAVSGTVMIGVSVVSTRDWSHPWVRAKLLGFAAAG